MYIKNTTGYQNFIKHSSGAVHPNAGGNSLKSKKKIQNYSSVATLEGDIYSFLSLETGRLRLYHHKYHHYLFAYFYCYVGRQYS